MSSNFAGVTTRRTIPRHRNIARLLYLSNNPLSAHIHWPTTLRTLALGWMFDNRICSSQLPQTILELDLGGGFNHQIDTISWPPGLLKLRTGGSFNRPIELATFPAGLQTLILGNRFNQPIEGVVWPTGLMHLELGDAFDQPIVHAGWDSTNLRCVSFSDFVAVALASTYRLLTVIIVVCLFVLFVYSAGRPDCSVSNLETF